MKSLTKKELSEELQHVYKQLADIKEDYRKSIETNSMIMKVLKEHEDIIDRINKEIEDNGIDEDTVKNCNIYVINGITIYKIIKGMNLD